MTNGKILTKAFSTHITVAGASPLYSWQIYWGEPPQTFAEKQNGVGQFGGRLVQDVAYVVNFKQGGSCL